MMHVTDTHIIIRFACHSSQLTIN